MLRLIEGCLNDMCRWFNDNKLVCNRDKTQFMYFTSKFKSSPKSVCINLDSTILHPTNTIRNLGVVWDHHLIMRSQVSRVCSSAAFSLNKIGQITDYLDRSSLLKLVHSYISSKLDYCNALFLGLPDRELNRLQRIQNSAARLVSRTNKNDHITPVLKELHWLPINFCRNSVEL